MRHIEIPGYGIPPCNGEVEPLAVSERARPAGLVVLGAVEASQQEWQCRSCGKRWSREPAPDQAL